LRASSLSFAGSNHFTGIKLNYNNNEFLFFSLYLRPSLADVAAEMESCISSNPASSLSNAIISCDCNAKNPLWNSRSLRERPFCDLDCVYEALPAAHEKLASPSEIGNISLTKDLDSVINSLKSTLKIRTSSSKKPRPPPLEMH